MKKLFLILTLFLFTSLAYSQGKRYIVVLKDSFEQPIRMGQVRDTDRERQSRRNDQARNTKLDRVQGYLESKNIASRGRAKRFVDGAVGFVTELSEGELRSLQSDNSVAQVIEDFQMQGRPRMQSRPRMQGEEFGTDWLYDESSKASFAIGLMGGSKRGTSNRSSIWILDSGIDASHRDLQVSRNPRVAKSFIDGESPFEDFAGHGTHVAGLAAGMGRGRPGITGMSAGAEVIPIKVLDKNGVGYWSNLVLALNHIEKYAVPGDVVMMSLGESGVVNCANSEPFLRDIILDLGQKGIFVVMSAGNDAQTASSNLPGCISGPNVFTVGSIDFSESELGSCSDFSNSGTPPIDWLAPGANVVSAYPGNAYNVMSGTSMACALVAGLIHSKNGAPRAIQTINCGGTTYSVAGR